jgi:hypothetical protein
MPALPFIDAVLHAVRCPINAATYPINHSSMKRSQTWPTFVVCILISVLLAGCVSYGTGSPVVKATEFGLIEGVDDSAASGTYYWLGVPFATPPVTALRWKAPVDPTPWKTTLATKRFGNACVQYGRIYGPGSNNTYDATIGTTLNTAVGSEDCLYLNIWRGAQRVRQCHEQHCQQRRPRRAIRCDDEEHGCVRA